MLIGQIKRSQPLLDVLGQKTFVVSQDPAGGGDFGECEQNNQSGNPVSITAARPADPAELHHGLSGASASARGEVLVRNLFMSVDPYMRGRMERVNRMFRPLKSGSPWTGGGRPGDGVQGRRVPPGDVVLRTLGGASIFIHKPQELRPVNPKVQPLSVYLGVLGMTGMTAWVGLNLAEAKAGRDRVHFWRRGGCWERGRAACETTWLPGNRFGRDHRTKSRFLRRNAGLMWRSIIRPLPTWSHLEEAAPDGIDVYFDNVGGEALEAALATLKVRGRIAACGAISLYNLEKPQPGPPTFSWWWLSG